MISFVNGFLCTSSCDEAKAKRGIDPHPKPGPGGPDGEANDRLKIMPASAAEDPAVVFGGSLASLSPSARVNAANAVAPSNPAAAQDLASTIDLLV